MRARLDVGLLFNFFECEVVFCGALSSASFYSAKRCRSMACRMEPILQGSGKVASQTKKINTGQSREAMKSRKRDGPRGEGAEAPAANAVRHLFVWLPRGAAYLSPGLARVGRTEWAARLSRFYRLVFAHVGRTRRWRAAARQNGAGPCPRGANAKCAQCAPSSLPSSG